MPFGFALICQILIDMWDIDLSDTDLDFLDTDIPSKTFQVNVLKTSCRHLLKTSWKHVLKTSWRHVLKTSWRHVLKTSSTRLQRNNFLSSKTFSRRLQDVFQDVFSSRGLQDVLEDKKLLHWRRFEDAFKTCLEDVFKTS